MDLKLVIREMVKKGVSESEIIGNLKELGVQDAEKVFADALKDYKPPAPEPVEAPKPIKPVSQPVAQQPAAPQKTLSQPAAPAAMQAQQPEKKSGFQLFGQSVFGGAPARLKQQPQQAQPVKQQSTSLFGPPQQKQLAKPVEQKPALQPKAAIKPEAEEEEDEELAAFVPKPAAPAPKPAQNVEEPEVEAISERPARKPIREALDEKPVFREFKAVPSEETQEARVTKIDDYGVERELSVSDVVQKAEVPPGIMRKVAASSADELEERLDETIALLKALQDINKRILETDRQVLLRLQK